MHPNISPSSVAAAAAWNLISWTSKLTCAHCAPWLNSLVGRYETFPVLPLAVSSVRCSKITIQLQLKQCCISLCFWLVLLQVQLFHFLAGLDGWLPKIADAATVQSTLVAAAYPVNNLILLKWLHFSRRAGVVPVLFCSSKKGAKGQGQLIKLSHFKMSPFAERGLQIKPPTTLDLHALVPPFLDSDPADPLLLYALPLPVFLYMLSLVECKPASDHKNAGCFMASSRFFTS